MADAQALLADVPTAKLDRMRTVLVDTLAYFERYGWTKRTAGRHGGRRCLAGGLTSVLWETDQINDTQVPEMDIYFGVSDLLNRVRMREHEMPLPSSARAMTLIGWNDFKDRTYQEVKALIVAAIEAINEQIAARQSVVHYPVEEREYAVA